MEPKNDVCWTMFLNNAENCNFVKIMLSPGREHDFEGFERLKIDTKSHKNRLNIEAKKCQGTISRKRDFWRPKASQNDTKSLKKPS